MNATAAKQIRKAYETWTTQYGTGEWMSVTAITHRTDLTLEEITEGVRHLVRTDDKFYMSGRADQFNLTAEDRANRLWIGNQYQDMICWP